MSTVAMALWIFGLIVLAGLAHWWLRPSIGEEETRDG